MAKKPAPPKLDSILNSPENVNMNEAVRAQIEAAQAQIDKETKEAKQTTRQLKKAEKEAKEATRQLKKAEKEAKEATRQLKKAEKEAKQIEKQAAQELKKAEKEAKEATRQLKKAEKEAKQIEKQAAQELKQTKKEKELSFKDKVLNLGSSEFNRVFPLLGKMMENKNNIKNNNLNFTSTNTASTDSSYFILADIVSSQQTTINLLKQILNVLKDDDDNSIDIPGFGRRRSSGGSRRSSVRAGGGRAGGILRILGLAFASVGAGALGVAAYDKFFNDSSINPQQSDAALVPPPITPIPSSQIYDRGEPARPEYSEEEAAAGIASGTRRAQIESVGSTVAQLLGRGQSPTQTINNEISRRFNNSPPIPIQQQVSQTIQVTRPIENYVRRLNELDRIEASNINAEGITNPNSHLLTRRTSLEDGFIESLSRLTNIPIAERPSPPEGTFERLNLINQRQGAPELPPDIGPRGALFAGEQDNRSPSLVSSTSIGDYSPEPMPFQRTIADIPREQRSRTLLAGTTTARLLGRDRSPTARINSDTEIAFDAIPRAMNSPAGSRTQETLGFRPEQYGPPAPIPSSQIYDRGEPVAAALSTTKTPISTPIINQQLQLRNAYNRGPSIITQAKTPIQTDASPKEADEEDGIKQYKADEIVFKADKFDFRNNQDSSASSPTASPAPSTPHAQPAAPSTGGSGAGGSGAGAATPMQPTIVTGPRVARASAENDAAGRIMPTPPQVPAAAGQNTTSGTQQRADALPQIDPNNPGPLEPADAGSRYARLFGMAA